MDREIFLTFDVEAYSVPAEFGERKRPDNFPSKTGLEYLLSTVGKATYFVTIDFARKFPKLVGEIPKRGNELALHGEISRARRERKILEKISGRKVRGFRAHRFSASEKEIAGLATLGFSYDSSINPTFVPGRYSRLSAPTSPHKIGEITEIPISTFCGIPLSFLWFRLLPRAFLDLAAGKIERQVYYFHPWEFLPVTGNALRTKLVAAGCGERFLKKFEAHFLRLEKAGAEFRTLSGIKVQ
ncbi:MAG: DUF3473 domain-containing protein [archaeon]